EQGVSQAHTSTNLAASNSFGARGDRRVVATAPFSPGAVVDRRVPLPEPRQRQRDNRGRHAGAAGADGRLRPVDSGLAEYVAQLRRGFQASVGGDEVTTRNAPRTGHVPASQTGAWLWGLAAKA